MKHVSATALFCEDIRKETGGRVTLIGVMADTLRVENFPGTLRRLQIYALIRVGVEFPYWEKSIGLSVVGPPGVEVIGGSEQDIPKEMLERGIARAKEARSSYTTIMGRIRLSEPVPIQESGQMLAKLHCDGESEICGLLNILLKDGATSSAPPSSQALPVHPVST